MRPVLSVHRVVGLAAAIVLASASFAAGTMVTAAGPDRTPPVVTAPPQPAFLVGGQLQVWGDFPGVQYTDVPVRMTWSASDPSGVCSYSIDGLHSNYGSGFPVTHVEDDLESPAYDGTLNDYDGTFGSGGGWPNGYLVSAYDCEYNVAGIVAVEGAPVVFQDDGRSATGGPEVGGPEPITLDYSGRWTLGSCACASGGTQRATNRAGAAVEFTRSFAEGDHVALVMATGPGRGRAGVYVDGELVRNVDTFAAGGNVNRIVVFDRALSAGDHTIRLVNRATAGHPRIDLDAVVVS